MTNWSNAGGKGLSASGDAINCDDADGTKGCSTYTNADFNVATGTVSLAVHTVIDETVTGLADDDKAGAITNMPSGTGANKDIVAYYEGFKLTQVADCSGGCNNDEFSVAAGPIVYVGLDPGAGATEVSVSYLY